MPDLVRVRERARLGVSSPQGQAVELQRLGLLGGVVTLLGKLDRLCLWVSLFLVLGTLGDEMLAFSKLRQAVDSSTAYFPVGNLYYLGV